MLLVDDDILVSMGAADMLLDLGHSVTEAQSGAHALKLLESDGPFDLVVTEYAMPGMNGFELAQRVKEPPSTDSDRPGDGIRRIASRPVY